MTDNEGLEKMNEELGSFKKDVREWFKSMESKLDLLLHPETGIYTKIGALDSRIKTLEKSKASLVKLVWVVFTPVLGALGIGLVYVILLTLSKG